MRVSNKERGTVCLACLISTWTTSFRPKYTSTFGETKFAMRHHYKRFRLSFSYLDVFPHAIGQYGHQYMYCSMSHFLAFFCLFLSRSCYYKIIDSNIRCLVTSAEMMDAAFVGGFLRYLLRLRPVRSCQRALQWQPELLCGWSLTEPSPVSAGIYHKPFSHDSFTVAWCAETSCGGGWTISSHTAQTLLRHCGGGIHPGAQLTWFIVKLWIKICFTLS